MENRGKSGSQAVRSIFGASKNKAAEQRVHASTYKLALQRTTIKRTAEEVKKHAIDAGRLRQIAPDVWETRGGLRFRGHSKEGPDRIEHLVEHLFVNPQKKKNSVFKSNTNQILAIMDEVWKKRDRNVLPDSDGRTRYTVDLQRPIGTNGETKVRLVIEAGTTNHVVTAFPI